ncbi:hypothetical protein EPH95_02725 [Salicibibacter halophilus]|uniref:Uncharacterized protein n=1 Tax=Salicibibacter halophilus TaxID=2502791 RepID=A0A514LED0_9BACI|nr:hypothetical protein [Salicibibacter halophilus]QDI90218.1 hypothetical protein EPH95_02725 [Salicibibacter halophilus]
MAKQRVPRTLQTTYDTDRSGQIDEDAVEGGGSGSDGDDGASAYEIAVDNGFEGSESDWLESLQGSDGEDGSDGDDGFGTEEQYNSILARLSTIEDELDIDNGGDD